MLNEGQVKAIRRGVNFALGLPEAHALGHDFVNDFVIRPCEYGIDEYPFKKGTVVHTFSEGDKWVVTTYDGLSKWCASYDYDYYWRGKVCKYRLTPERYQVLRGFLEALQAVLKVQLLNEGGDLPLPPGLEVNDG